MAKRMRPFASGKHLGAAAFAAHLNELVDAVNCLLSLRGDDIIQVKASGSGVTLHLAVENLLPLIPKPPAVGLVWIKLLADTSKCAIMTGWDGAPVWDDNGEAGYDCRCVSEGCTVEDDVFPAQLGDDGFYYFGPPLARLKGTV